MRLKHRVEEPREYRRGAEYAVELEVSAAEEECDAGEPTSEQLYSFEEHDPASATHEQSDYRQPPQDL